MKAYGEANQPNVPLAPDRRKMLLAEAISAARENQASTSPYVALSGVTQEAQALMAGGDAKAAVDLLKAHSASGLSLGMQAEYLYTLGLAEYDLDHAAGLADLDKAVELAPTAEFKKHLSILRDNYRGNGPQRTTPNTPIPMD